MNAHRRTSGEQRRPHPRSKQEWAVRCALVFPTAILAILSVSVSIANVAVLVDPGKAHAIAPNNGTITAAYAEQLFNQQPKSAANSTAARLSREALLDDPTAVQALSVLGLQAQLRADGAQANRIFGYSVALSRREMQPQLWAIENAVARGDIRDALEHYDLAMRLSEKARSILFPILSGALVEPRVRSILIDVLASKPVWTSAFFDYAANNRKNPQAAMEFFRAASRHNLPVEASNKSDTVGSLVARNEIEDAWNYYSSFRRDAVRNASRDPDFALTDSSRTPFDWTPFDAVGLTVSIAKEGGHGLLDFAAPPATRATVVSQIELLQPGLYRLNGRSQNIKQPARTAPYWLLTCRGGQEIGRVDLPNSNANDGHFWGEFEVPLGCPVQNLSLVIRASDEIDGVVGQILEAKLAPVPK